MSIYTPRHSGLDEYPARGFRNEREAHLLDGSASPRELSPYHPWPTPFGWLVRMQICTAILGAMGIAASNYMMQCKNREWEDSTNLVANLSIAFLVFLASWQRETDMERVVRPVDSKDNEPVLSFAPITPLPPVEEDGDSISIDQCYRSEMQVKEGIRRLEWAPSLRRMRICNYLIVASSALGALAAPILQMVAKRQATCSAQNSSAKGLDALLVLTLLDVLALGAFKGIKEYQLDLKRLRTRLSLRKQIGLTLRTTNVTGGLRVMQKRILTSIWGQLRHCLAMDAQTLETFYGLVGMVGSVCAEIEANPTRAMGETSGKGASPKRTNSILNSGNIV